MTLIRVVPSVPERAVLRGGTGWLVFSALRATEHTGKATDAGTPPGTRITCQPCPVAMAQKLTQKLSGTKHPRYPPKDNWDKMDTRCLGQQNVWDGSWWPSSGALVSIFVENEVVFWILFVSYTCPQGAPSVPSAGFSCFEVELNKFSKTVQNYKRKETRRDGWVTIVYF